MLAASSPPTNAQLEAALEPHQQLLHIKRESSSVMALDVSPENNNNNVQPLCTE